MLNFHTALSTFSWADLNSLRTDDLDSDDEFFRKTTDMLSSSKKLESLKKGKEICQIKFGHKFVKSPNFVKLLLGYVEYRKLKDINHATHNEGTVIRAAEFHPSAAVGLVGM